MVAASDTEIMTRARPTPPRPLIQGPSAWTGADLRERQAEWTYCLSPTEIAEIEAALKSMQARGPDIADVHRADFPLPTLGPVLDRPRAEVLHGRGFVRAPAACSTATWC
jgi:hypothetical protein